MAGLIRGWKHRWRVASWRREILSRLANPPTPRPHGLPWPLVVNVTSYPARFPTLHATLAGLLTQTVEADRTVLWLAHGERRALPQAVRDLPRLEIRDVDDLRSYKKIVPALDSWPEAAHVTADDDVPYAADWLEGLVDAARSGEVVAHRAHRIAIAGSQPRPYAEWDRNLAAPASGPLVFPTGVGGVLYPPGTLPPETLDRTRFEKLAPTADDVWLWFMHRRAGAVARKIGGRVRVVEWPGSQREALRSTNQGNVGNDRAMKAMIGYYGWPVP